MSQQVFISYRQESPAHARAVRRLGELLRQAQLPVALDQFYLDDNPGGPAEGWPKWSQDGANQSACVLVIGSAGWFAAYEGNSPSEVGRGAASEAHIIRQKLYDAQGLNPAIRLAFLQETAEVPVALKAWHQFRPYAADAELKQMIRWIADCLGLQNIEPPTVYWPEPIEFNPDLADRIQEWPVIEALLAGRAQERILLFQGASGLGKFALVREAVKYAKRLGIRLVEVNFKGGGLNLAEVLGQFDLDLGALLPNFSRDGTGKTHLLRKDLRALRQPVLVIFDSYEDAVDNKAVTDWLNQQFLAEVETATRLAVIIAGQKVPDIAQAGWRELARPPIPLQPISDHGHWEEWVGRRYPGFYDKGAHLPTVVMAAGGNPAIVSNLCAAIVGS